MENKKDIQYSFNLVFTDSPHFSPVRLPGYKFIYRTEKIENPTTAREIWKSSQSFLKEKIAEYNNYEKEGKKPILVTYQLAIFREEKDEDKPPKEKVLYSSIYKIEGEEKNKIEEKKKYQASETIEANFYIYIVPTVYFFRERKHNPREDIDEEKKNIFRLSKCCICKKKPPNVLFVRCFHRVVCSDCDESEKPIYCPICKNCLHGTRKETFLRKKVFYTSPIVS